MIHLLVLLAFILLICVFKNYTRPKNFPPGPKGLRFVGNVPLIKRLSREKGGFHLALTSLAEQFNTNILGLQLGSDLVVVVFSEENLAQVHLNDEFLARPDNFFTRLRTMGVRRGITITDGELWLEQHKFALKHLHQLGFGKVVMKNLIQEELKHFIEKIKAEKSNICITKYLAPLVLNVLWTIVAGTRFSIDDHRLTKLLEVMNARGKAFDMSGGVLNQFPWLRFISPEKSGYKLITELNSQLSNLIKDEIAKHKKTRTNEIRDFIDLYLAHIEDPATNKDIFNEDQLVAVCLDFFIAGSQTTSNTIGFALLAMIRYPDVQEKVQQCLDAVYCTNQNHTFKFIEDKRLNYVTAVLLESMRTCHVVPVTGPRRATRTTAVGGYTIPEGTTVLMSVYSILQDKTRWGDPEVFRPERFLDSNGDIINSEKLYFYGRGKRRCIGEALARNFILQFFTSLVHQFKFTPSPGKDIPTTPIPGITLSPRPFYVDVTVRDHNPAG